MKLLLDIGNTNITIGIFDKGKWQHIWRLETKKDEPALYYSLKLNNLLWEAGINAGDIDYSVFSTVVPELKDVFSELLFKLNKKEPVILDRDIYSKLDIHISNPFEIGSDLVANAVAAHHLYKDDIIIVDFGTALTFTVLDSDGTIAGINIAPGVKTAIDALVNNTSQLPKVELEFPLIPLGSNTVEAIQNGVLVGYIGLVKYMIKVIKNYKEKDYKTVTTGGLASLISPHLGEVDYLEPNLTLYGLLFAGEMLEKHNKES